MKSELIYPYSLGLYLAVNAIPDSYLVMDGPTCCFYRADFIQGNHDAGSDLMNCSGMHRVLNTCADVNNIVLDRSGAVRTILVNLQANPLCKCVFVAALPMSYLTGVGYEGIIDEVSIGGGPPIHLMPQRSLQADWLAGYADALEALARNLDLSGAKPVPGKVGIVGYFMDRGEEDHLANLRELRRLLEGLALETAPVWLSGEPCDALKEIKDASVIVSLPHARRAARTIAEKTGAVLIETGLPFGLKGTTDWLQAVAAATGREKQAEAFIAEELGRAAEKIEWLLPNGFIGRRFLPIIDPHLVAGFLDLIGELGGEVPRTYATAEADDLPPDVRRLDLSGLGEDLQSLHQEQEIDLALCNAFFLGVFMHLGIGFLEFGFPSHTEHCLHDRPHLGYRGALSLIERMYNRMQLFRLLGSVDAGG